MATKDVPGSKAANKDTLAQGSWAEKGSDLVLVEKVKAPSVVFLTFDTFDAKKIVIPASLTQKDFEKAYQGWTWHDKTPFPWDRVLK